MTLKDYIAHRLEERFKNYRERLAVASESRSEDAIHDLRVASRRILEAFGVLEGALDEKEVRPVRKGLRRWMRRSGSVRDLDVVIQLSEDAPADNDAAGHFAEQLRERRRAEAARLFRFLDEGRPWDGKGDAERMTLAMDAAPQSSIWDLSLTPAQNAVLALPLLLERYVLLGDRLIAGQSPGKDYHRFRLRTKRLRYTLELFGELYPARKYAAFLAKCKRFQDLLGMLQDSAVADTLFAKASKARMDSEEWRDGDAFVQYVEHRAGELRAQWHKEWRAFVSKTFPAMQAFLREKAAKGNRLPPRS